MITITAPIWAAIVFFVLLVCGLIADLYRIYLLKKIERITKEGEKL